MITQSIVRTLILTFLYFFYLYSFQIPGTSMGTVLPSLCIMLLCAFFMKFHCKINMGVMTKYMVKQYVYWNVFLLVYVFFILQTFGEGNGITPLKDYVQMIIILPVFFYSGNVIFRNLNELMTVLYLGVIIQSIIIIIALFMPALTLFLFALIPEGGYNTDHFGGINMITQHGYHIGLGVFTSAGSIKMAFGQVSSFYYLIKSQNNRILLHIILFLVIAVASSVVSRTGMLISIVGLTIVIFVKYKQKGKRALNFVLLLSGLFFVSIYLSSIFMPSDFFSETFMRIIDLSERGAKDTYFAGFTGDVGENVIPPISGNTLLGLGITYGVSGTGVATYTDGGFMRNYSAMGLFVAIINYFLIFSFLKKQFKRNLVYNNKYIVLLLSLILLIGEFKESCVYFIYPICFIFLIFSLMEKDSFDTSLPTELNINSKKQII